MADQSFNLIVIGSGPGGYVAAIRAAQLGMTVAVVEREQLGGVCLNWGCIPTKALLRASEINHLLHHLDAFGFAADNVSFDLAKVVQRSRAVANQLSNGVKFLLKKHRVTVLSGDAELAPRADGAAPRVTVRVTVRRDGVEIAALAAAHVIIATGARARTLPGLEPDGRLVWTYREAMVPLLMPKSLLVVGSGAIGIEFASFYRQMGAEVTVVEAVDRILPAEDEEIARFAHKAFVRQGIALLTGAQVTKLDKGADCVTATIASAAGERTITIDRVVLAIGIVGNVERLGLETTRVEIDKTHIKVDPSLRTAEPGVYAIGDVVGPPWLAHKASHEGVLCVERIAGLSDTHPLDVSRIPACTYSLPQIASIGLTEARAVAAGYEVKVGRFPYLGNGKAIALGEPEGLVKTVFDAATGELLGAHMIGAEVTELIQGYAIARTLEATEADLIETIFPHPTLSETMHEAVLDAYGRAIHI